MVRRRNGEPSFRVYCFGGERFNILDSIDTSLAPTNKSLRFISTLSGSDKDTPRSDAMRKSAP